MRHLSSFNPEGAVRPRPPASQRQGYDRVRWFRLEIGAISFESFRGSASGKSIACPYPAHQIRRCTPLSRFRGRFLVQLGTFTLVMLFVIASATLWSIRSDAIVNTAVLKSPIVDATSPKAATGHSGQREKISPPAPVAQTHHTVQQIKESGIKTPKLAYRIDAAIHEPPRDSEPSGRQLASTGQGEAGILNVDRSRPSLSGKSLSGIPIVRQAVAAAARSGEMQDWSYGHLDGFVIAGPVFDKAGTSCRKISILARDGGFTGQTEALEHCETTPR